MVRGRRFWSAHRAPLHLKLSKILYSHYTLLMVTPAIWERVQESMGRDLHDYNKIVEE